MGCDRKSGVGCDRKSGVVVDLENSRVCRGGCDSETV